MAKRPASQLTENLQKTKKVAPPDGFLTILARAGQEKYGDHLNFEIGCTSKGYHLIVGCKLCHLHPPAGSISRTRIVYHLENSPSSTRPSTIDKIVGPRVNFASCSVPPRPRLIRS